MEQNNEEIKVSMEEDEPYKESAKNNCKDSNSMELAPQMPEENSLVDKNVEILHEVVEQKADNDEKSVSLDNDNKDFAEKDTDKIVQKQVVEILNVELVAPWKGDLVESVGCNNQITSEVNINGEKGPSPSSGIDISESAIDLEEVKINTIKVNADPTPGENQHLGNGSGNVEKNTEPTKTSGLGLLAQYQSDDDADSVVEVPLTAAQDYRNQVVEIDSDSDSDGSSSSSDVEYLNEMRKTIEKRIGGADEDDGEDEDQEDGSGKRRYQQKLRVKGEMLLEDLPPIQDLQITVPENDCIEFGKIHSIVDQLVLVSALPNSILLDLETVIFLEKGQKVLGEVFDVLGQVGDPLYCVRFNSNKQIKEKQIKIGEVVYVAPKTQYTQYVILSKIMGTKGSDASWENDMEPPPRFLDYSDDEQEQLAKKQQRNKDRPNDNDDVSKRCRTVDTDDSMSTTSSQNSNVQHRNRYEQRNNRGSPAGYANIRPRYNGPHQNQQRAPHHHRSSWHSNYNSHNFPTQPPSNFRPQMPQNQTQSHQAYNPNMPVYGMPNSHNMPPYLSSQPPPYGVPPMFHQHAQQLMPNTLNIRPPTLHGPPPHAAHHNQYTSSHPPPPGSQ